MSYLYAKIKAAIRPCKRAFKSAHADLNDNCCDIDFLVKRIMAQKS